SPWTPALCSKCAVPQCPFLRSLRELGGGNAVDGERATGSLLGAARPFSRPIKIALSISEYWKAVPRSCSRHWMTESISNRRRDDILQHLAGHRPVTSSAACRRRLRAREELAGRSAAARRKAVAARRGRPPAPFHGPGRSA